MKKIQNVILCGLGAIGTSYATKISKIEDIKLKILVDKKRLELYKKNPRKFNRKQLLFDYILPDVKNFKPDLIIIATKSYGLKTAIKNITNFVNKDTIILSLLNGIDSEEQIAKVFNNKIIYSFVLGGTIYRNGNNIHQTGVTKLIFGSDFEWINNSLTEFFIKTGITFEERKDIQTALWQKFAINCCLNQISAITGFVFKELYECPYTFNLMKNICSEIESIAKLEGVKGYNTLWENILKSRDILSPDGKSSMLQDIENKRPVEIDIFGETIEKLGKRHNIPTPYNEAIKNIIKAIA